MNTSRHHLCHWIARENIQPENIPKALSQSGVFPGQLSWLNFIDRLLLWSGTLMTTAGVIFFFAYNWNELPNMAKFALVQGLIIASILTIWRLGIDSAGGKAGLFAGSIFVGALLALIGQIYQTGADTYELFTAWAVLIFPWILISRLSALWLFWIGLVNISLILYYSIFGGLFGLLFSSNGLGWSLLVVNTLALVVWQGLAIKGVSWLDERWAIRLLAVVSGVLLTTLTLEYIFDSRNGHIFEFLAWPIWMAAAYWFYRKVHVDIFILAGGVLSGIVVVSSLLGRALLNTDVNEGSFLLIGLVVIGLSAAGATWLKRIIAEHQHDIH